MTKVLNRFGIEATFVNTSDIHTIEKEISLIQKHCSSESPTNPLLKITDLESVSKKANANGLLTIVDNTFNAILAKST